MITELECLPCFFAQVSRTLKSAGIHDDRNRRITGKAAAIIEQASLDQAPARITTLIHRMLRETTGIDPYRTVKEQYNQIALSMLPRLRQIVAGAPDPLEAGVRLAIAGNIIDFGIFEQFDLDASVEQSLQFPLSERAYRRFKDAALASTRILYLCDNAGEIVFDRVLIEILHRMGTQVTAAVKGSPVINDATRADAAAAELSNYAGIIDNGNDGIGTLLEACSDEFMREYRSADMIISKGQANYETLMKEQDTRLFFLFKVKCPVVAKALGRGDGEIVLMSGSSEC
jgi:uncharacterized protein with ATP-grasp and redox domains